jgi:hypothetical protein
MLFVHKFSKKMKRSTQERVFLYLFGGGASRESVGGALAADVSIV